MTSSRLNRIGWVARLKRVVSVLVGTAGVRPLAKLMPRHKDLWLFGYQKGAFAGNSKALFLWLCAHRPDIKAVWISSDPDVVRLLRANGYLACRKGSIASTSYLLRAGAYFFCHGPEDISLPLSGGALLVNLWQSHFSSQFRLPPDRCPPLGYPRLDSAQDVGLAQRLAQFAGSEPRALWPEGVQEVYAYVPTFRDSKRAFLAEAFPDMEALEAALERRNAVLFIKLHRHTAADAELGTHRIRPWPDGVDLDVSLPHLTGLITDYSSVHYDYIYHSDSGSILYPFDGADYHARDRLLLYPYDENTAGYRASSFPQLIRLLESGESLKPHPDVPRVRHKFWGNEVGPASQRVVQHVEQLLGSI
jgi:CDP-glycerol glycerophosphotransferase (TagB/SpsB family)